MQKVAAEQLIRQHVKHGQNTFFL